MKMQWQIETPVKYEDLTEAQAHEICNGCGGKGGWVKPPHRIFFAASCDHHDYGYSKGCNEQHRKQADKKLYQAMVNDCRGLSWVKWLRYRPWCWAYYLAVRTVGWKFFQYGSCRRWPAV